MRVRAVHAVKDEFVALNPNVWQEGLTAGCLPSGVIPSDDTNAALLDSFQKVLGYIPILAKQPVIEEGNRMDYKQCLFNVCAGRCYANMMNDLSRDLEARHVALAFAQRDWLYRKPETLRDKLHCITRQPVTVTYWSTPLKDACRYLEDQSAFYGFLLSNMLPLAHSAFQLDLVWFDWR